MKKKSTPNVVDGKKIKSKRKAMGMSQVDLASKADVSQTLIWRLEELNSDTCVSNLSKIATELHTTVSELMLPIAVTELNTSVSKLTLPTVVTVT